MKLFNLLFILAPLISCSAFAQTDTINAKNDKLVLSKLHEGVATYLVYTVDSTSGKFRSSDIWIRRTKFENKNSLSVIHLQWEWYHHDTVYRYVSAYCKRNNFAPLFQFSRSGRTITAYNFSDLSMTAADTVPNNKADLKKKMLLTVPVYNWEWDMELFSVLPYHRVGQKFQIAFLDPSGGEPAYYPYNVIAKEDLELNNSTKTPCWVLRIEYEPGAYGMFWIDEKTGEMLKMKELYKGTYRYKVKLY